MRSASGYGSGLSSTDCTTVKMALLAPMQIASVRMVVKANDLSLNNRRSANRRSWRRTSMGSSVFGRRTIGDHQRLRILRVAGFVGSALRCLVLGNRQEGLRGVRELPRPAIDEPELTGKPHLRDLDRR